MVYMVSSSPKINSRKRSSPTFSYISFYLLLTFLLYFVFIFHLPRCSLLDFPFISFLASLPFLSRYLVILKDNQVLCIYWVYRLCRFILCLHIIVLLRTPTPNCTAGEHLTIMTNRLWWLVVIGQQRAPSIRGLNATFIMNYITHNYTLDLRVLYSA